MCSSTLCARTHIFVHAQTTHNSFYEYVVCGDGDAYGGSDAGEAKITTIPLHSEAHNNSNLIDVIMCAPLATHSPKPQ